MEDCSLPFSPSADEIVEEFLDSLDLLEGIEFGDIDLSTCINVSTPENSDSDSGISVSCENATTDPAPNTVCSGSSNSDCVLTEAVCGFPPFSTDVRLSNGRTPISVPVTTQPSEAFSTKPIRIFKLPPTEVSPPSVISAKAVHKIIPVKSLEKPNSALRTTLGRIPAVRFKRLDEVMSDNVRLIDPITTEPPIQFVSTACVEDIMEDTLSHTDIDTFLDRYDPTIHADSSLELHLEEIGAGRFSTSDMQTHSPFQKTLLENSVSRSYLTATRNGIFTQVNLERIRKKHERMIKNRHAASMSRQRKKEYLERLEMRYEQLRRENLNLWRQNEEWRTRCERLETCLTDLQSQITNVSSTSGAPSMIRADPSTENKQLEVTQFTHPSHVKPYGSVTSAFSITPRMNSSNSSSRATTMCNVDSSTVTWSNTMGQSGCSKPADIRGYRKTVASNVFYSTKCVTTLSSDNSACRATSRPSLINLTGLVTHHRSGNMQAKRPKLIATTSLLCILCLFTLNTVLPQWIFSQSNYGRSAGHAHFYLGNGMNGLPTYASGQRMLLSLPEDGLAATDEPNRTQLPTLCHSVSHASPGSLDPCATVSGTGADNTSRSVSNQAWQQWIQRHNRVTLGHLRSSWFRNAEDTKQGTSVTPRNLPERHVTDVHRTDSPFDQSNPIPMTRSRRLPRQRRRNRSRKLSEIRPLNDTKTGLNVSSAIKVESTYSTVSHSESSKLSGIRASEQGLQPFYRQVTWNAEDVLEAAGRKNGTVYLILSQLDSVYLHAIDPIYENQATKITLIVPAYAPLNNSRKWHVTDDERAKLLRTMLLVECELQNVSLIHPSGGYDQKSRP